MIFENCIEEEKVKRASGSVTLADRGAWKRAHGNKKKVVFKERFIPLNRIKSRTGFAGTGRAKVKLIRAYGGCLGAKRR